MNIEHIKQKKQEYADRYNAAINAKDEAIANAEHECSEYLQSILDDAQIDFPGCELIVQLSENGVSVLIKF
jgi:hypothetical protein